MILGVPGGWYTYGFPPRVDWYRIEQVYRSFPMVTYCVEQLADQAIGPGFYLKAHDDSTASRRAVEICDDFNEKINAKLVMLRIARELALYGNSPVERRFDGFEKDPDDQFKVTKLGNLVTVQALPISTMRIVPDMYTGADPPKGYTQIIMGQWKQFAPEQIAWFKTNVTGGYVGSDFYGMGLVQPVLDYVWGLQQMEDYMVRIMRRYAAPKILWQLGDKDFPPKPSDIQEWAQKLTTIKPDEDWVGSFLVNAKPFSPDVRTRFEEYADHFQASVTAGLQNPNLSLMMAAVRVSDASATAMQEAWNRKIQTAQEVIKENWEDLIFKPLVVQQEIDEEFAPELIFGEPEVEDPETQMQNLTTLLNPASIQVTPQTRFEIENLLRQLLQLDPLPPSAMPQPPPALPSSQALPTGPPTEANGQALAEKIRALDRSTSHSKGAGS
jgi:hypothetical protein